jgi:CheY-like chemotaxis protein
MRSAHLNILLVEDNVVNQKVLSKQLEKVGCTVTIAGHGVEALTWVRKSVHWRGPPEPDLEISHVPIEIDIVLMDIEMPIMDGLTCARAIREYENQGLLALRSRPSSVSNASSLPQTATLDAPPFQQATLRDFGGPGVPAKKIRLPILAVSANARTEQVEQALTAGMDDLIAKPFRIPDLWPKMERLMRELEPIITPRLQST